MKPFDAQQQATIDELIEGVQSSREAGDAQALALYAKQLGSFVPDALALQVDRANNVERFIVLESYGVTKISVIKALRAAMDSGQGASAIGIKEAKTIVESAPIVLARVNVPLTDALLDRLRSTGASIKILTADGCKVLPRCDATVSYFESGSS